MMWLMLLVICTIVSLVLTSYLSFKIYCYHKECKIYKRLLNISLQHKTHETANIDIFFKKVK
ncbi:hypothetical protein ACPB8Q_00970 [Methanocaldococcus indicus]|uniref:hypothetical protein n=1 Tax=Methanocaldococcus indicus TaxID=213231 RepID=UPI003C6CDF9A